MAKELPPHVKQQAEQAVRDDGNWAKQAYDTRQDLGQAAGIDQAQRSHDVRQQPEQTQQPDPMKPEQ